MFKIFLVILPFLPNLLWLFLFIFPLSKNLKRITQKRIINDEKRNGIRCHKCSDIIETNSNSPQITMPSGGTIYGIIVSKNQTNSLKLCKKCERDSTLQKIFNNSFDNLFSNIRKKYNELFLTKIKSLYVQAHILLYLILCAIDDIFAYSLKEKTSISFIYIIIIAMINLIPLFIYLIERKKIKYEKLD